MKSTRMKALLRQALGAGEGVLRLAPTWVPRAFLVPGRRLKLDPRDLYILGAHRGGIDERWFASTVRADNGPATAEDEGLSYIVVTGKARTEKILLRDAIELAGEDILGKGIMRKHGGWMVLAKFFDNAGPIPHHLHQSDEHAAKVGRLGKPEAYYFPVQLNAAENEFPYTFFGLDPSTTKEAVARCLRRWNEGDNEILYHSRAYKLKPGTGWDVPPGVLHAPGSLVTYEPQRASDVFAMFQSAVAGRAVPRSLLTKDVPPDRHDDLDYIIGMLDWEANVDPYFREHHYREPKPAGDPEVMGDQGYQESWVVYGSEYFSAKELSVSPGRRATVKDEGPYGAILLQGHGRIGPLELETPTIIRYGQLTNDEVLVTAEAASRGVEIVNESESEPLVMLKHFGPAA